MRDDELEGQRFALEMPDGTHVTVTATADAMAIARRIRFAIEAGTRPDPADVARLFAYLSEDT